MHDQSTDTRNPAPEPLTGEQLAAIAARADAATQNWRAYRKIAGSVVVYAVEDTTLRMLFTADNATPEDAEFAAHAPEDIRALLADNARLRARFAELERPEIERQRNEVRQSYSDLAAQAREDRDYAGEAFVLQQLVDREQQWAAEDTAARRALGGGEQRG